MLSIQEKKPELNTPSDSIKAKLFLVPSNYYPLHSTQVVLLITCNKIFTQSHS